jgi:hypothetical protein
MENVRLSNGNENFLLGSVTSDNLGPIHGLDSRGFGYTRCDAPCDHEHAPEGATVWHDDEHTEELWEVK